MKEVQWLMQFRGKQNKLVPEVSAGFLYRWEGDSIVDMLRSTKFARELPGLVQSLNYSYKQLLSQGSEEPYTITTVDSKELAEQIVTFLWCGRLQAAANGSSTTPSQLLISDMIDAWLKYLGSPDAVKAMMIKWIAPLVNDLKFYVLPALHKTFPVTRFLIVTSLPTEQLEQVSWNPRRLSENPIVKKVLDKKLEELGLAIPLPHYMEKSLTDIADKSERVSAAHQFAGWAFMGSRINTIKIVETALPYMMLTIHTRFNSAKHPHCRVQMRGRCVVHLYKEFR